MLHNFITRPEDIVDVYGYSLVCGVPKSNLSILKDAVAATNICIYNTVKDGKTLAWWGCTYLRAGVAELWIMCPDKMDTKTRLAIARAAKDVVARLLTANIFRLEMAVGASDAKWAEFLGFEYSHICRRYDGVNDQLIYVREA